MNSSSNSNWQENGAIEDENTISVGIESDGMRLDLFLAQTFRSRYSRAYFQYLIKEGLVLLNGLPVKKREKLTRGDEIEIEFTLLPELDLKAENIPLEILYEDDYLIAVNKPAGMVVHPATGNWSGTFVNALLWHCQGLPQFFPSTNQEVADVNNNIRPGIVHRLDKDTSGVLIAAKTLQAQQKMIELFAQREVQKEYCAIVCGNVSPEATIDFPIGRHPNDRQKMSVALTGGKAAITHYKKLADNDKLSFVHVIIETGRTHQIRVHMKHIGHPVLGDAAYGHSQTNKLLKAHRQMLHAYKLSFVHPFTHQQLQLIAPLPEDFLEQKNKITHSPYA